MPVERTNDEEAPEYAKQIDYQSGRNLWLELFKADVDTFKWLVGLIPVIIVVAITFITDILQPISPRLPVLLYAGWGLLGATLFIALYWFNRTRAVADEVSWYWTLEHFDRTSAHKALQEARRQAQMARVGRYTLYSTLFLAFTMLALFVGINLGETGVDYRSGVIVNEIEAEAFGEDSFQLDISVAAQGDNEQFNMYFSVGDEVLPEVATIFARPTPTAHSLSFMFDEVERTAVGYIYVLPGDVVFDPAISLLPQIQEAALESVKWKPERPPKPGG